MQFPSGPDRTVLAIIAMFTAVRLLLAAALGLGVDETYTLSVAHDLELSYFDHPPLQYWIAHLLMPLLGDGRSARLPFIALFAGSCWLLYRLTRVLFSAPAGVVAVLALNCSAFFTFGAGGWVLPDGPLLVALLAAALVLARAFFPAGAPAPPPRGAWLHAGLWLGVAALCKYHALLFVAGVLVFLVSVPARRGLLRSGAPWLAALLALMVATPVIVWNVQHEWISLGFQAGRGRGAGGLHPENVLANVAGQAVWMLPWILVPMLIGAWRALRAGPRAQRSWYCVCLALPTILIFTLMPLWGRVGLPHWQMPGWLMLYPVLGDYAVRELAGARLRRLQTAWVVLVLTLGGIATVHTVSGYGRMLAPRLFARVDPTLDALEWSQLPPELRRRGLLGPGSFIITTSWVYAGKIDQALHDTVPVVVFGNNPKQYGLRYDPHGFVGRDALLVAPRESLRGIATELRPYFASLEELAPFALGRSGQREIELQLFLGCTLRTPLPDPYWRR